MEKTMRVLDLHCDTIEKLWEEEKKQKRELPGMLYDNSFHLDVKRMSSAGYLLQNFAIFVDRGIYPKPYEAYREMQRVFVRQLSGCKGQLVQVRSFADIRRAAAAGKMAALLTVEEGGILEGRLSRLQELYADGVRMMTLTWNYHNELAAAAAKQGQGDSGLTALGKACVEQMQELHMIVDTAHLSDRGIREVLALAKQPVVASHSNARSVCRQNRNLPPELVRGIAKTGGVIGLNYFVPFLVQDKPAARGRGGQSPEPILANEDILYAAVQHVRALVDQGGIACVALGSDFDGITTNPALPDCSYLPKLWEVLHKAGFGEEQLEQFFYKNALRVYREVLKPS